MELVKIAQHFISKIIPSDSFQINSPVRDLDLLYPGMKIKAEKLLKLCSESGKTNLNRFKVFESFRSAVRQRAMYESGTSQRKSNGMHWFGIAVDIVSFIPYQNHAERGGWEWRGDYAKLTEFADDLGLTHLRFEQCHFQYIPVSQQNDLVATVTNEVIHFQQNNGLKPDGIIGNKTIAKAKEIYKK